MLPKCYITRTLLKALVQFDLTIPLSNWARYQW